MQFEFDQKACQENVGGGMDHAQCNIRDQLINSLFHRGMAASRMEQLFLYSSWVDRFLYLYYDTLYYRQGVNDIVAG